MNSTCLKSLSDEILLLLKIHRFYKHLFYLVKNTEAEFFLGFIIYKNNVFPQGAGRGRVTKA